MNDEGGGGSPRMDVASEGADVGELLVGIFLVTEQTAIRDIIGAYAFTMFSIPNGVMTVWRRNVAALETTGKNLVTLLSFVCQGAISSIENARNRAIERLRELAEEAEDDE